MKPSKQHDGLKVTIEAVEGSLDAGMMVCGVYHHVARQPWFRLEKAGGDVSVLSRDDWRIVTYYHKVRLCNVSSIGTLCGYGTGKTRQAAIDAALEIARRRDSAAYYNEQTGEVCFSELLYC